MHRPSPYKLHIPFHKEIGDLIHAHESSKSCYRWQTITHRLEMRRSWASLVHPLCFGGCYTLWVCQAAPILLGAEACVWRAMVWGKDVHPSLSGCTTVSRMEGRFWRKNSLGRRLGDSFWGSEPDLSVAWWCTCQQCGRVLSLGGSSYCSFEVASSGFCGTGPGWEGTECEPLPWVLCLQSSRCSVQENMLAFSRRNHMIYAGTSLWKLRIHSGSWGITCASLRRSLMECWELSRPSWSMLL
jgi:hypothetical protein